MKIKRIILQNPATIGTRFPERLIDTGMKGIVSMELIADIGVEIVIEGDEDPWVIPLSNISVLIPIRDPVVDRAEVAPSERKKRNIR